MFGPFYSPPPPPPPKYRAGKYKVSGGKTLVIVAALPNGEYSCRWLGDSGLWTASEGWLDKHGARSV